MSALSTTPVNASVTALSTSLSTSPACQATGIGWRHPHYAELLQRLPPVGFLQVHSENFFAEGGAPLATLAAARAHYPISLHGVGLSLGSALGVDDWHLDQLARLVQRIEPIRVSDHACFARGTIEGRTVHAADLLPLPFTHAALAVLCANVQRVQERLQRPLLVENLSAYVHFAQADMAETEFLNTLCHRTGCQILLDVNNIYVNALNDQIAGQAGGPLQLAHQWLDGLQADCVGELHLAGHCVLDDIVIDDHGARVCESVWQLYAHAVQRFGNPPALVEWDTQVPALDVLLGEAQRADILRAQALSERGF
jgi:uncharacterized protein